MIGASHLTTGVTTGAWFAAAASTVVPDPVAVLAVAVVSYAALLPDLDTGRSTATYSLGPVTIAASWILRRFVVHRGATHRIEYAPAAFGATAAAGSALLPPPLGTWWPVWGLAVALGVAAHIWGDARTVRGVPWRGRRATLGRPFATGSDYERWLLATLYRPMAVASVAVAAWVVVVA